VSEKPLGYGCFWMGQPIEKMTREELVAALLAVSDQLRRTQIRAISDIRNLLPGARRVK
jgi:hypothetical protein